MPIFPREDATISDSIRFIRTVQEYERTIKKSNEKGSDEDEYCIHEHQQSKINTSILQEQEKER